MIAVLFCAGFAVRMYPLTRNSWNRNLHFESGRVHPIPDPQRLPAWSEDVWKGGRINIPDFHCVGKTKIF
jgi:hypothetical protein